MRIENSFIPVSGVGERTERRLWETGITHWDEFDGQVVGPTIEDRIRRFIEEGRAQLDQGNVAYFADRLPAGSLWRLYANVPDTTCYLDIETTGLDPDRNRVTTVSCHRGGETSTYVAGVDLTSDRLQTELDRSSLLVTFNGKRFDVPFLEANYPVDVSVPHVDLCHLGRRIGLSGGLKSVERDLGIDRDRPDLSGRDAVRLWHRYEDGDETALETLVRYNRDDTANLEPLLEIVAARLHDRVFAPAIETGGSR